MIKNTKKIMEDLASLTSALIDVDKAALLGNNRRRDLICGRMALANFLNFELKYHYTDIAKYLGRDRTNMYHYEGKHRDNYNYWREYRELYDNIKASYVGVDNAAMTNAEMTRIITDAGIVSDTDNSFMISFKIGYSEAHIYTADLDKAIKQLKEAFKSFNYSFSVEHRNTYSYAE